MNKILIILILLLPSIAISQKCSLEIDKIDESTKMMVKRTVALTIFKMNGNPFVFKTQRIGDKKFIKLRYIRNNNFSIIEGSNIIFYFNDGNKLKIEPMPLKNKSISKNGFTTVSSLIVFELDDDSYASLTSGTIKEIGFYTNTGLIKNEIKTKHQDDLQHLLYCIL